MVFDAQTAEPLGVNREARRIVEALRLPGRPAEELLGVLTSRLADGRAATLDDLRVRAETLRGEEVELSVPDGRSLRMLVNVTPIRDAGGAVETVVVTMQDLAPLEKLHRQRAEFLALVGHELRAPLTSIKGSTTTLLGAARPLGAAEQRQFHRIIDMQADHMTRLVGDLLDVGPIDAGTLSVDPQPVAVAALVERARATFLAGAARLPLRIELPAGLPRVMADGARIAQVLHNLFANAARYSPASAPIHVAAVRDGIDVAVSVTDEGPGCRRSACSRCSGATPTPLPAAGTVPAPGRASPSARASWRRTVGASARPTRNPDSARGSPSPCPQPRRPATQPPRPRRTAPVRRGMGGGSPSWSSTTTRRPCATCAARSPPPATRPSPPATRTRRPR